MGWTNFSVEIFDNLIFYLNQEEAFPNDQVSIDSTLTFVPFMYL